jgi:elongation factor Ts
VAKTEEFRDMVEVIAGAALKNNTATIEDLLLAKVEGNSIGDLITEKIAKIGENISVRRFQIFGLSEGVVEAYIHGMGRIGVLVEVTGNAGNVLEIAKDVAMQVAAAKPEYVARDQVPVEAVEKEKEILKAQAINEGKPANIAEKMVTGRLEKYFKEICLLEQPFIKDTDINVQKVLEQNGLKVTRFVRYEMGEGLQKRENDLAAEVAAMTK